MAVPAQCETCANTNNPYPQQQPELPQPHPTLGVIFGVLGGCALVALLVAVVVPAARHRARCKRSIFSAPSLRSRSYRRVRDADLEQQVAGAHANAGDLYLPSSTSRRSSIRHQKMSSGPDARPFLLPLLLGPLKPISALSWSVLSPRTSSPSGSANSLSIPMAANSDDRPATDRTPSFSTDRATTSHRSTSARSSRLRQHVRYDELGRPVISDDAPATRSALPSPQRSPIPPGLPGQREHRPAKTRRASLPLPITPTSPSDPSQPRTSSGMPLFSPVPASAYAPAATPGVAALSRHPSGRPRAATQKPGMEPVLEDAAADAYAETRSLQLPSPPASPEALQPHWRPLPLPPSSTSSTTRRRPSLTTTQSAPSTAMAHHRPRSSTGPAIPLTAAFQTSVLRSATQSTATGSAATHRYPSIAASPPPAPPASGRARPSSVSVTMTSGGGSSSTGYLSPESPDMPRPTEAFRRMSTTDIHHRRGGHHHDQGQRGGAGGEPLAFLRSTDAARTTEVQPGGPGHDFRAATVGSSSGPSFTTPPPHPLSPPAVAPTPPRLQTSGQPPVRAHVGSVQQQQQAVVQQQGAGPALVRRRDSPALRPLPVSAIVGGSGVAGMSLGGGGSRSRSNSVRSTRTGAHVQLPPLDPVTPLTLSLRGSSEEEERGG